LAGATAEKVQQMDSEEKFNFHNNELNKFKNKVTKWPKTKSFFYSTFIYSWLLLIILGCTISTLQLMTVFDLQRELAQLPISEIKEFFPRALAQKSDHNANGSSPNEQSPKPPLNENTHLSRIFKNMQVRAMASSSVERNYWKSEVELYDHDIKNLENDNSYNDEERSKRRKSLKINQDYFKNRLDESNTNHGLDLYASGLIGWKLNIFGWQPSLSPPLWYLGMTSIMLTLLVSLYMGALGSAIRMTVELLKCKDALPARWYFFQPFLGALLAFSVFILFKAGYTTLSVGGSSGAGDDLNPYIIAFVGIVSGMLSEKAYRKIGVEGSRFLAEDATPRWIRPDVARERLGTLGKAPEELKQFFTKDVPANGWLDGSEALAPQDQTIVAAWLQTPAWKLLTDQKPAPLKEAEEFNETEESEALPRSQLAPASWQARVGRSMTPRPIENSPTDVPEAERTVDAVPVQEPETPPSARMEPIAPQTSEASESESDGSLQGEIDEAISTAKELAKLFHVKEKIDVKEKILSAIPALESARSASSDKQRASLKENAPPILIATNFVKEVSAVAGLIGLAFPPAVLGLGIAKLAADLTGKQYERWYARVMDEEYSPAKFEPDRLDPSVAHTLIEQSSLWKGKIDLSDRARAQGIVKAALAADEGETLWNNAGFGIQQAFAGNREAFNDAVDELRKQAQKVGVDLDLRNMSDVEGTKDFGGNGGVMEAVDKIRTDSKAATAQAWLDVLMTTLQWCKDNGKGIEQIIDQFKSARTEKKGEAT
jgi:hypothetical protein